MCSARLFQAAWLRTKLQMDHVAVGEVQSLNSADLEVLSSVGEVNCRNPGMICRNRDALPVTIGLVVEVDRIATAGANDRIVAVATDVHLLVVATGRQRALSLPGTLCAAGIDYVAATKCLDIRVIAVTGEKQIVRASRREDCISPCAGHQPNIGGGPAVQSIADTGSAGVQRRRDQPPARSEK